MNEPRNIDQLVYELPDELPLFPLPGVVLLPRGRLPLNVFEPRYLTMVEDALGSGRIIGMIQPTGAGSGENPPLYKVGCAGKIVSFSETEDGRYLVSLLGISRFLMAGELDNIDGYRRARVNWDPFTPDLTPPANDRVDRHRLFTALRHYFKIHGIVANWEAIQATDDEQLIISLTMICPFESNEKQALIEALTLTARAELLLTLLEMAALHKREPESARH